MTRKMNDARIAALRADYAADPCHGKKIALARKYGICRSYVSALLGAPRYQQSWLSDAQAKKLVGMFRENFKKFEAHVGKDVLEAAPALAEAAE